MRARVLATVVSCAFLCTLVAAPVASATPPANDNFASATQISALPFSDTVDASLATVEPGEFTGYGQWTQSVWYRYVATSSGLSSRVAAPRRP